MDRHGLIAAREELLRLAPPGRPEAMDQIARIDEVLYRSSGVLCDALADDDRVVPGQVVIVVLECWNTTSAALEVRVSLRLAGAPVESRGGPLRLGAGAVASDTVRVQVPPSAGPTRPYYLEAPVRGAWYQWPAGGRAALGSAPFEPRLLEADFALSVGGALSREVTFRTVDQAIGEVRRPVLVVPRVSTMLQPATAYWPAADRSPREYVVTLRHAAGDPTVVRVGLQVPAGWTVSPPDTVRLTRPGEERRLRFALSPLAATAGTDTVRALVDEGSGPVPGAWPAMVDYPHIQPRQLVQPAEAAITVIDARLPADRRIAYVRGAADRIPEALATLGLPVTLLKGDSLARADLTGYATLVIGPRAFETDPGLVEQAGRLVEYARQGGTVIVQYQQQPFFRTGVAPYPLSLAGQLGEAPARVTAPRVSQEDAPVTPVEPAHALFHGPNRINSGDWNGWVQERGLYFARSWSPDWTPLLEMADRGEPPQRGGLLVAPVGKGWYVYTGLSFFRQLPAAVPGAMRLFLNLLALGRTPTGE